MISAIPNGGQLRKDRWVRFRIGLIAAALVLGFTGVNWRLYELHVRQHDRLSTLADEMRQLRQPLAAHRGSIRDRDGELLAHDEMVFELYADRFHLRELNLVRRKVAALQKTTAADLKQSVSDEEIFASYRAHLARLLENSLQQPAAEIQKLLASRKPETVLCKGLNDDQAAEWRKLLHREQVTGIYLRPTTKRAYPALERLTHVLGDVNHENHGDWGVEALMDKELTGVPGERWIERDNKGRELPFYRGKEVEARNGRDVFLTIDMHLQEVVESILEQQCLIYSPQKAIIVLTDPKTGSILAMASRPHYQRDSRDGMWRNLAISDPYEPGSTFKLVTMCAALDLGRVSLDTEIFCHNGHYEEPALKMVLRDDESLGTLRVEDVLAHSSNIGTYKIAKQVGSDDFLAYAWRLGFGQKTGIGLKGERAGYLNIDNWTGTTFSRMAMGYEVSVTPLQLAMTIGAIANGGVLMQPRIIDRVAKADGSGEQLLPPVQRHQICKARTARLLAQALTKAVTDGTGKKAAVEGITVAGKTGTSQRYDEKLKRYADGHYNTSFIGFAPAEDPQVACVVLMDDPKAERSALYGGKVAAPIFSEVVTAAIEHLSVDYQRPTKLRLAQQGGAGQ